MVFFEFAGLLGVWGLGLVADGLEERGGFGGVGSYRGQGVVPGGGVLLRRVVLLCESVGAV